MKTVVTQILAACRKHGIPSSFWTDVAHDVADINARPGDAFHWYLYGNGTHLHFTDQSARIAKGWKVFTVNTWRKCMAENFSGGKYFHCDGSTLKAV